MCFFSHCDSQPSLSDSKTILVFASSLIHVAIVHLNILPSPARSNQAFDLMSLPMIINILSSSLAPRNAPLRRPPRLLSHASGTPARVHCMTRPGMLLHLLLSPFSRSVALLVISYHTFVHLEWMRLPRGAVRGLSIPKSMSNAKHFFTQQLHSSSYLTFDCCNVFPSQHMVVVASCELSGTWSHVVLQSCHVCSRLTPSRSASYRPLATSLSLYRTLLISLLQTQSQHNPLVELQFHCAANVCSSSLKRELFHLAH